MVIENNTISLLKMFEGRLSSQYCEVAKVQEISRIAADYMHSNIVYALTTTNELVVMEYKQPSQSSSTSQKDQIDCKSRC